VYVYMSVSLYVCVCGCVCVYQTVLSEYFDFLVTSFHARVESTERVLSLNR